MPSQSPQEKDSLKEAKSGPSTEVPSTWPAGGSSSSASCNSTVAAESRMHGIQSSPSSSMANAQNATEIPASLGDFKTYNPSQDGGYPSASSLPSSYFDPTPADLKATQASLSARATALRDAPLLTQKLRDEKEKDRRSRWPTVTIRIRFANRTQLEKMFPSDDKIRSVYAFVRACLRADVRVHKFVLYQTPPRRDLKVSDPTVRDMSLFDLQLAPASVLLFRFLDENLKLDIVNSPPPLFPAILSQAVDLPPPPRFENTLPHSPSLTSSKNQGSNTEKKIPKWLKATLKK